MLSDNLSFYRARAGLTQSETAARLGVTRQAYNHYETGKREPPLSVLKALAEIFDVSVDDLTADKAPKHEKKARTGVKVPLLGTIRGGEPSYAFEDIDGEVEISERLAATGEFFALRLRGDSMAPAIMDGDIIIVRRQDFVESGEVAAVLIDGEDATCKQVVRSPGGITLVGFNASVFTPRFYSAAEIDALPIRILGKVVETRRNW